jgi:hypothetical protein
MQQKRDIRNVNPQPSLGTLNKFVEEKRTKPAFCISYIYIYI